MMIKHLTKGFAIAALTTTVGNISSTMACNMNYDWLCGIGRGVEGKPLVGLKQKPSLPTMQKRGEISSVSHFAPVVLNADAGGSSARRRSCIRTDAELDEDERKAQEAKRLLAEKRARAAARQKRADALDREKEQIQKEFQDPTLSPLRPGENPYPLFSSVVSGETKPLSLKFDDDAALPSSTRVSVIKTDLEEPLTDAQEEFRERHDANKIGRDLWSALGKNDRLTEVLRVAIRGHSAETNLELYNYTAKAYRLTVNNAEQRAVNYE